MQIDIGRARPDQARRLSEIAWAAKRHWGYADDQLELWRDQLTLSGSYVREHTVQVASVDGSAVALYAIEVRGETVELEHFWVTPEWIGRGVGRSLLEHCVESCRALGAAAIEIDSDPYAEGFYVRMGARRIGKTPAPTLDDPARSLPRLRLELA